MSRNNEVEVSMAGLGKYAAEPTTPELRDEVNKYLSENIGGDAAAYSQLSQTMANNGLIGDIVLAEFGNIDGKGGYGRDGSLDLDEIRKAARPGNDPTTMLAANFLLTHGNEVRGVDNAGWDIMQWGINPLNWEIGGFGPGAWIEDKIEVGELNGYQRKQAENATGTLADSVGFGNFDEFNAFTSGADAEKDGTPDADDTFDETMSPAKLQEAFADPDSSAEQRLQAAMALHKNNVDSFTIKDKDGRELDISIKANDDGQISLWVAGFPNPLMRGFVKDGKVTPQGSLDYYGDNWRKKYDEDATIFR